MLHRGYEVWISDGDKKRIPEFGLEVEGADGGKTVTCYIPSERGKRFVICWKDHDNQHHWSIKTFVDGKLTGASTGTPGGKGRCIGVRVEQDSYRTFQFADLPTTDDDDAAMGIGAASLDKVGTIEVHTVRAHAQRWPQQFMPATFEGVGAVHERSKKLGAHCTTLGESVRCKHPRKQYWSKPLDRSEGPYVTFVFRYRPSALLQAQSIMPPPVPAPTPAPTVRNNTLKVKSEGPSPALGEGSGSSRRPLEPDDVIELSDDDDNDMTDSKPNPPPPRIKREPRPRTARVPLKADPDDLIDLTLD